MKKNVGYTDRIIRLVVGIVLVSLFFVLEGNARYIGLIGLVPLMTAALHFCPAYTLLGFNTCGKGEGSCCGSNPCGTEKPEEGAEEAKSEEDKAA